jgi:uncharacterized protein YmfQ (DUF2313 family)
MRNILKAQEAQLDKALEKQNGTIADMYPSQAIHPERWEDEYAVDKTGNLEQRRKNIMAKRRGMGTVTLEMVRDIVEAYADGEITMSEDNDDSMMHIEIVSATTTISDADRMEKQLYETIPAHMDFRYAFKRPMQGEGRIAVLAQTTVKRTIGGQI